MLFRKHTAFRVVCLYAMVTAVCAISPALSARRHNSQKSEQHLQKFVGTVDDYTSVKTAKNVLATEGAVIYRHNERGFFSKLPAKNTLTGLAAVYSYAVAVPGNFILSSTHLIKTYSRLLRPEYYSFLFRYTPF